MNSKELKAIQAKVAADEAAAKEIRAKIATRQQQVVKLNSEIAKLEQDLNKLPAASEDASFVGNLQAVREKYGY